MPAPYRLLAIDVDGTLLNSRSELPPANREALHRLHEAGVTVCICTGRSVTETRPVIEGLGLDLDAGVFVFGAVVADLRTDTAVFRNAMPPELADRLIDHLTAEGHPVLVLYDASQAGFDYLFVEGTRNRDPYERWLAFTPTATERTARWQPRAWPPLRVGIIEPPDRIAETLAGLKAAFGPAEAKINSIYAPNYDLHVVECFAPEVNKWHGISQLASRLGIRPQQVAAVGDDVNDLEMIRHAGLGVAMGNAIEPIRQAAALEVPRNDEAGVAVLAEMLLSDHPRATRKA